MKTGNTIAHILATDLRSMTVYVPGLDEQTLVATCLTSLDSVLTAETQKLAALKLHKRGLMQRFPSPEEAVA